jgi:NADPH:quinone reductase-like Zn-dependent oxidoreductase
LRYSGRPRRRARDRVGRLGRARSGPARDRRGRGVSGLDEIDRPVDIVLDSVGGPQLVEAWRLLAPGGSLQSIGWTSGEPAIFEPYSTIGPPKALTSFLNEGSAIDALRARRVSGKALFDVRSTRRA